MLEEPRGAIVAGPRDAEDDLAASLDRLSRDTGWPVFADAASGLRSGPEGAFVVHGDLLLRSAPAARTLQPVRCLRLGLLPASKVLSTWLDQPGCAAAIVAEQAAWIDPSHRSEWVVEGETGAVCSALAQVVAERRSAGGGRVAPGPTLRDRALEADRRIGAAVEALLDTGPGQAGGSPDPSPSEPALARAAARALPRGAQLVVASSMPVRDVDAFAGALPGVRVLASRGVNGIDGLVSTALGAALGAARPTALLCGDLAFLHDLGGLVAAARLRADLVVVAIDNDGGGIFDFLPIAQATDRFEALFSMPHGLDLPAAARLVRAQLHEPRGPAPLADAVRAALAAGGLHLVHVRTDRRTNVAAHREVAARAVAALDGMDW
jgi:2-succinyl-5-enolpyruvyl-6-hydroxy-3-cyclohexene-1-carboxylate synthase